jgi:predicted nucleic acid-binding protein
VGAWLASVPSEELFISVLVIGEIRRGIERLRVRDPAQAGVFERWLSELREHFGDRIVPIDAAVAEEWGRINAADPVPVEDGLMAATAKVRGMVFVTRNVGDVARTGVALLDPWDSSG